MFPKRLYNACKSGDLPKVQKVLKRGADPNGFKNRHGCSLLFVASSQGSTQIVRELLAAGAHVNEVNEDGTTPLLAACNMPRCFAMMAAHDGKGPLDMLKALLDEGADVHKAANDGKIPLHVAAKRGLLDIVKALLDAGAQVNTVAKDG